MIVGLGNPGKDFNLTRHNMGFLVLDNYAKTKNLKIDKKKFNGLHTKFNTEKEEVILLKPQSFMNLSGGVVAKYLQYFKIDIQDLLIISDDLDLPYLKFKLKYKGTSGGHNGLKDIEKAINSTNYKRMKIGISNNKEQDTKEYVLAKLSKKEKEELAEFLPKTEDILDDYLALDFESLMSKYNKR